MTQKDRVKYEEFLEKCNGNEEEATWFLVRWKCLTDLFYMGSVVMGWGKSGEGSRRRIDPRFHRWLAGVLQREEDKLLLVPRLHLKTTWVKLRMAQRVLQDPNIRLGYFSENPNLVRQVATDMRNIFMALRPWFPDQIPEAGERWVGWEKVTENHLTIKRFPELGHVPQEPQITALGAGARMTGGHVDELFADDIISPATTTTEEQMRKSRDWWAYMQSILELGGLTTMTGTFYHYNDLYNMIIKEGHFHRKQIYVRRAVENGEILYKSWFRKKDLEQIKKRQGPYIFNCNPGWSKVWMADCTFRRIDEIRPGDWVIGFERGDPKRRASLLPTEVLEINHRTADVVKITMASGRSLVCTPDHQWYTGRLDETHKAYRPAAVGMNLLHAVDLPKELDAGQIRDWSYLAGIVDGEGSCKYGSIFIAQSRKHNAPVCERIESVLIRLGLDYQCKVYGKKRVDTFYLNGGRQTKVDLINYGRPAKAEQLVNTIWRFNKRPAQSKDKIVSIEPWGAEEVYALTTSTGNYVVHGYLSKNCQYMLNPTPTEEMVFPPPQPTYSALPKDKYSYYIAVDPAATTAAWSDKTAVVVCAVNALKEVYIVEALAVKKPGNEVAELLLRKVQQYKPIRVGIELGLQEHLRHIIQDRVSAFETASGESLGLNIEPIVISRKMSKGDRVNLTLGSFVRQGKVYIHESCSELMRQMDSFTGKRGDEDDLVDAASMLFAIIDGFARNHWLAVRDYSGLMSVENWGRVPKESGWRANFVA